jgi:signal transduction histidine kinase
VTVSLRVDEDRRARIVIRDRGRGMSEAQVASLFDVDFGTDERVHARFGLAVCRSVFLRHGGEVSVESALGEGTTVTLTLPLADAARRAT